MTSSERTPVSLLDRLRHGGDDDAWSRFVRMYSPLMFFWARRAGLQEPDAADLVQDVFAVLVQKMPSFVYNPDQSFRSWLRTILTNKVRARARRAEATADATRTVELADVAATTEFLETQEERRQLLQRALGCLRSEFQAKTWDAFRLTALVGRPAQEVAVELNLSINAVYIARSRVLHRLREEVAGLDV